MRDRLKCAILSVTVFAASCSTSFAQKSDQQTKAAATGNSRDLSGVWVTKRETNGAALVDPKLRPPMTSWAQARFDAAVPSIGPRAVAGKENDPNLKCYPDGIPKILTSPEPFEIVTTQDKILMLFEKDHGWRQIWTNGEKLPDDPDPTYDGYSVGKWEGDTFVVESNGFNDRIWLDYLGDPRSESLHLTERYQRIDHDTLSITVTIDDPKAYTQPWVGKPKLYVLKPNWKIMEWYCTPDDITIFDKDVRIPSGTPHDHN